MTVTNVIQEIVAVSRCVSKQPVPVAIEAAVKVELRFRIKSDGSADLLEARAALQTLLDEMPENDVRRVHALMYAGRDGDNAKAVKEHFCGSTETRADLTRTILEKIEGLGHYLTQGLKRAEADGLDIDSF